MGEYLLSNDWFDVGARGIWDKLMPQLKPQRILEIGSYEGAATCYLVDRLAPELDLEIHCVDTWEGGIEHKAGGSAEADMNSVEERFRHNVSLAVSKARSRVEVKVHKGLSDQCLSELIGLGKRDYFDFIYVDGSHEAPDVLCDAVLGFRLLRVGGIMAFDDYLWSEQLPGGVDLVRCPKPAIDAFITLYIRKLTICPLGLYQMYVQKKSD
jgi:hypothetical protein